MRRLIYALIVVASACGPTQAQPSATPTAASATSSPPSTASSPLFAVLEADGAANPEQWNAVAITGLDGHTISKATFTPMPVPNAGCMAAVLPRSAHVAAGRVYFADGAGVIRSLSADGQIAKVTTFPFTGSQQMLSFVVSPDGSRLLGAVFTLAPRPNLACSGTSATNGYALDVYSASPGGPSTLLYHRSLPPTDVKALGDVMSFVDWNRVGPLGTDPTEWATQGGGFKNYFGNPVLVDSKTGRVLQQVSDPLSCTVADIALSGDFMCTPFGTGNISVRQPDGREIWKITGPPPDGYAYALFLAPDEQHLVAQADAGLEVIARDGTRATVAAGFFPEGWLDSATVIGTPIGDTGRGNLSYIRLSSPGTMVDMGFKGLFLGTGQS